MNSNHLALFLQKNLSHSFAENRDTSETIKIPSLQQTFLDKQILKAEKNIQKDQKIKIDWATEMKNNKIFLQI